MANNAPLLTKFDPPIQVILNERFSLAFLYYKIPVLISFLLFAPMLPVTILGTLGIILGIYRHRRESVSLLLLFVPLWLVYMLDCALLDARYLMPPALSFFIFAGRGFSWLLKLFNNRSIQWFFVVGVLFTIVLLWSLSDYLPFLSQRKMRDHLGNTISVDHNYGRLLATTSGLSKKNSFFYVVHNNDEQILSIIGYRSRALVNLFGSGAADLSEKDKHYPDLIENDDMEYYFIDNDRCRTLPSFRAMCEYIRSKYDLLPISSNGDTQIFLLKHK